MSKTFIGRTAAAIIAAAALALVIAACSGSPSSGSGGSSSGGRSTGSPSAVAYSHCMRSRGVPDFPDPGSGGQLPKTSAQHLGISSSRFNAAQSACQHLLPATGASLTARSLQQCYLALVCPQALVRHAMSAGLQFARCMRSHGVLNWPDPTIDSKGRPLFNITVPRPTPAQDRTAMNECGHLAHAGSLLAWG